MSVKRRGLAALSPERRREIAAMGGRATKSRPFRDNPGLAAYAGTLSAPGSLDTGEKHDNNKEMGGPDKGKAGTAPSPNDAEEASRDGQ